MTIQSVDVKTGEVTVTDEVAPSFPSEAVVPPLTARQFRLGLVTLAGRTLQEIDEAIANLPDQQRNVAEIEWNYATQFDREHPTVILLASILGFTDAEVDAIWEQALEL